MHDGKDREEREDGLWKIIGGLSGIFLCIYYYVFVYMEDDRSVLLCYVYVHISRSTYFLFGFLYMSGYTEKNHFFRFEISCCRVTIISLIL
jgi:hypothetical protein